MSQQHQYGSFPTCFVSLLPEKLHCYLQFLVGSIFISYSSRFGHIAAYWVCFYLAECMYLILRDGGEHTAGAFRRALRGWREITGEWILLLERTWVLFPLCFQNPVRFCTAPAAPHTPVFHCSHTRMCTQLKRKLNEGHCEKITFIADILSPEHYHVVTLPTLYLLLRYGLCTRAVYRDMLFNHAIRKIQAEYISLLAHKI